MACGLVRVRHTPFPGQSECFVAVLLTILIHIDGASYLKGYCSLMYFIHVFYVFYKSEKNMFFVCFLFAN